MKFERVQNTQQQGVNHDLQGESGLARHGPRRQRQYFHRFRRARRDPVFFSDPFREREGHEPEELIAAAHAGCFTMALAFQLQGAGYTPTELNTEAAVTLEPEGQGSASVGWL